MKIIIGDECVEILDSAFISILTHANVKARELASDFESSSHDPDIAIRDLFYEWFKDEKDMIKLTDKLKSIFFR